MRSKVLLFGTAALVGAGFLSATPATAHQRSAGGVLVPAQKGEALPAHGATVDSLNWSGYAVTGSNISAVDGTFTVPPIGYDPPGFAATWAGIGGFNSGDSSLIQAGVGEDPVDGYFAWYELLPASETPISGCTGDANCTVNPGDKMTIDISNTGGNNWSISLSSSGTDNWSFSKSVTYSSSESSAEWILEAPTLVVAQTTLDNVGTVFFGSTSTYTQGGSSHTIASGNPDQVDLGTGVVNEATPSALASDGQSFNDCAYTLSTCPTP